MENQPARLKIYSVILIVFLFEILLFERLRFHDVRPELLLILTIFFGLNFGVLLGLEAGAVCGILKDLSSVGGFGANMIIFLMVGVIAGLLTNKVFKESFLTEFLLAGLGAIFASLLYFFYLKHFLKADFVLNEVLWKSCAYKGLYTGIVAPLIFFIMGKVFREEVYEE